MSALSRANHPKQVNLVLEAEKRKHEFVNVDYRKIPLTHKGLCELARRWLLKRTQNRNEDSKIGGETTKAWSEITAGYSGEIVDAYGIRSEESILVEVKMSISDFKADSKKPHRQAGKGVGDYRYYMAPVGLLSVDILPLNWGLIEVDERRRCYVRTGHLKESYYERDKWLHQSDHIAERQLLLWKI